MFKTRKILLEAFGSITYRSSFRFCCSRFDVNKKAPTNIITGVIIPNSVKLLVKTPTTAENPHRVVTKEAITRRNLSAAATFAFPYSTCFQFGEQHASRPPKRGRDKKRHSNRIHWIEHLAIDLLSPYHLEVESCLSVTFCISYYLCQRVIPAIIHRPAVGVSLTCRIVL